MSGGAVVLYSLVATAAVALVSLVGAMALASRPQRLQSVVTYLVSLAIGGLLGGAFLHLIPVSLERFEEDEVVWLLVIGGFLASFLLEKKLGAHSHGHDGHGQRGHTMARMIIVGDSVHNFLDGIVIASAFVLDIRLGVVTTLIVLLHEVPQEFGDFGVLISGGFTVRRALKWNLISGLIALAGAALALAIGTRLTTFADVMTAIAAGNFIYIAGADLVPHLHDDEKATPSTAYVVVAAIGVALMFAIHEVSHRVLPH